MTDKLEELERELESYAPMPVLDRGGDDIDVGHACWMQAREECAARIRDLRRDYVLVPREGAIEVAARKVCMAAGFDPEREAWISEHESQPTWKNFVPLVEVVHQAMIGAHAGEV